MDGASKPDGERADDAEKPTVAFVNRVGDEFEAAVGELSACAAIGIGTDTAEMGRKCKLCLVVASTPRAVYAFDVQAMRDRAFDRGLRDLLESDRTLKIVHDSRRLADCLFHKHRVRLNNVFDTQVADVIVYRNKYGSLPRTFRTFEDCLSLYLGINETAPKKIDIVEWSIRPIAPHIKELITRNVLYLHELRDVQNTEMMAPFVRGVDYFVNQLRQSDDLEAWRLSAEHKRLDERFKQIIDCKLTIDDNKKEDGMESEIKRIHI